jgi:outer membrane receptor protein involved in Fe transport
LALGVTVNYTQGEFGKPSSVVNDPFDPFASPPRYIRVDDSEGTSVQLAGNYEMTRRLSLRGWVFDNRLRQNTNQYDDASLSSFNRVAGSFRERATTTIRGITLQPKYDTQGAGVLTFSASTERDSWTSEGLLTTAPDTFSPLDASRSIDLYSIAAQYEVSPLKSLGLVGGYGHHWQNREERNEQAFSAFAGASYDIGEATRLNASFSRNIRFPALGDLYEADQGNPDLVAERADTVQAGVEQGLPSSSAAAITVFHTIAKNLIQNDQSIGRSTNLAEARFRGMEVTASTTFADHLLLRASYAYLDSEDRSRTGRDRMQYTPRDKASLEGRYDFGFGLSPYLSLLYVGNQFFYTRNNVTPVQKAKLDDYWLVNVKLSQAFFQERASVFLGADNLFDRNYETSYGFPQPGRFVYGGARLRF